MNFATCSKSWFKSTRFAIYLITGYVPINSTLHKRGISDTSSCSICGENEETTDHIIFDCAEYQSYRWTEMTEYRDRKMELIKNEHNLEKFNIFAKIEFERRQEIT